MKIGTICRISVLLLLSMLLLCCASIVLADEAENTEAEQNDFIPSKLIAEASCGENVSWKLFSDGYLHISGSGEIPDYDKFSMIQMYTFTEEGSRLGIDPYQFVKQIDIEEGITRIGNDAFRDMYSLEKVWIRGDIAVGDRSFCNCHALSSFDITGHVMAIGESSFQDCYKLTAFDFSGFTEIPDSAFRQTGLTSIILPDTEIIGNAAFAGCDVSFLRFSDKLTTIGNFAFTHADELTEIVLPEHVKSIGYRAFLNCTGVKKVTIPGSVEQIGDHSIGYIVSVYGELDFTSIDAVDPDFVIYGTPGTEAENYAVGSGISFLPTEERTIFSDVARDDWFYENVQTIHKLGYMTGMSAEVFGPYEMLSRAQFATILYRMAGAPEVSGETGFRDVSDPSSWYYAPVLWAKQTGVVTGYQNGLFGPADPITREQAAAMLYRVKERSNAVSSESQKDPASFVDFDRVSDWAKDAVRWAITEAVITGKDGGTRIDPFSSIVRSETAAMIDRFVTQHYMVSARVTGPAINVNFDMTKAEIINGFTVHYGHNLEVSRNEMELQETRFSSVGDFRNFCFRQGIGDALCKEVISVCDDAWFKEHNLAFVSAWLPNPGYAFSIEDVHQSASVLCVYFTKQRGGKLEDPDAMVTTNVVTDYALIETGTDVDCVEAIQIDAEA